MDIWAHLRGDPIPEEPTLTVGKDGHLSEEEQQYLNKLKERFIRQFDRQIIDEIDSLAAPMTTSQFVRSMEENRRRDQIERNESWDSLMVMAAEMCNAGLVSDVVPDDGVTRPLPPLTCATCGTEYENYPVNCTCLECGQNYWRTQ